MMSEEKKKRPPEAGNWVGRRAIRLGNQGEDYTQRSTDASGSRNSPAQRQQSRRPGVKQWWVRNGKLFEAQPCGNLVVDDAIGTGGENAEEDNLKLLHRQRVLTPNEVEVF